LGKEAQGFGHHLQDRFSSSSSPALLAETRRKPRTDKLSLKTLSFSRAKREAQLNATVVMVGELQGIIGQAMPEIAAIDGPQ